MGVPQIASYLMNTNEEDAGQLENIETRKDISKIHGICWTRGNHYTSHAFYKEKIRQWGKGMM